MSSNKIAILLIDKGQELIKKLIPKIIDVAVTKSKIDPSLIMKIMSMDKESAKQGGIDEILKQAGKIGVCIPATQLKKIIDLRNLMIGVLNAAAVSVDTLSKTLDPLKTISDVTDVAIITAKTTISVSKLALSSIPPPFIVPPPFSPPFAPTVNAAMLQVEAIELIVETLTFYLNGIINQINSIQVAIDSVNPIFTKMINLFKVIDKYLLGCNINTTDIANSTPLTPLNPYLQALDNAQKQQVLDAQNVNAVDFPSSVYKGFTLDIVKESFSPTVDRVKAVAKNPQGIIMLQTPLSFTTTPQVLVSEIKLIIDLNPNLKAE
jgi:hypothetical protein